MFKCRMVASTTALSLRHVRRSAAATSAADAAASASAVMYKSEQLSLTMACSTSGTRVLSSSGDLMAGIL